VSYGWRAHAERFGHWVATAARYDLVAPLHAAGALASFMPALMRTRRAAAHASMGPPFVAAVFGLTATLLGVFGVDAHGRRSFAAPQQPHALEASRRSPTSAT
jgi:hypothetical protein